MATTAAPKDSISKPPELTKSPAKSTRASKTEPRKSTNSRPPGSGSGQRPSARLVSGPSFSSSASNQAQLASELGISITDASVSSDFRDFQSLIPHPLVRLGIEQGPSPFDQLAEEIKECLVEFEGSLEELLRWKERLGSEPVSSMLKLESTVLLSKLYRTKSELHQPLFELVKQAQLYSRTWNVNRAAMIELEKDYHRHYYVLDVAIRKLEGAESRIGRLKAQHQLSLWEKLVIRVMNHLQGGGAVDGNLPSTAQQLQLALQAAKVAQEQEESEMLAKSQLEWFKLKHSIIDGIIDDPSWRLDLRATIQEFKQLLSIQHPGWSEITKTPWHRKGMVYLSTRSGTCRPKRPMQHTRSASVPNLRLYYRHEKDVREYRKWVENRQNEQLDELGMIVSSHTPNPLRKRVRVNSFNAYFDLSDIQALPNEPENNIDQMHLDNQEKTDEPEEPEEPEYDFSVPDMEYFKSIMSPEAREAIVRLVEGQKTMDNAKKSDEEQSAIDEKDTFKLEEVMELTLLHAQQLHVMKEDFEDREHELQLATQRALDEKDQEIKLLKEQLQEARDHPYADDIVVEHKDLNDAENRRRMDPRRLSSVASESGRAGRSPSVLFGASRPGSHASKAQLHAKSVHSMSRADLKSSKSKLNAKSFKDRNVTKSGVTPTFNSMPFKLSFFERLDWFTQMSLQYHERHRKETQKTERFENERKLAYLNLIQEEDCDLLREEIPAEFMPMPGDVPPSLKTRGAFIFSDHD
ncbi:hypothetical protein HDV03_004804 [Kappamyces sp. JEL0829]|nr:hypothetical protein HDV03_004804 [Kappamyces sp. JEL0829]